jgi:hypothetical protein
VEISFRIERNTDAGGGLKVIGDALRESGSALAESTASLITAVVVVIPWLNRDRAGIVGFQEDMAEISQRPTRRWSTHCFHLIGAQIGAALALDRYFSEIKTCCGISGIWCMVVFVNPASWKIFSYSAKV